MKLGFACAYRLNVKCDCPPLSVTILYKDIEANFMCPTPQIAASRATPTFYPTAHTLCPTAAPTTLTAFLQPTEIHHKYYSSIP